MSTAKRHRSPNYPAISLEEALPRIQQIYEREFTHAADTNTLAQAIGYSGSNGASDVVLSALKKYGLLEHVGNKEYKLSNLAIDIVLHQQGEPERIKAILEAAFTPPLFAELHDEFGINPPPSENNLRVRLLKREFNPKTVGDVIRAYRETIELVAREAPEYNKGASVGLPPLQKAAGTYVGTFLDGAPKVNTAAQQSPKIQTPPTGNNLPPVDGAKVLNFSIGRNLEAKVVFNSKDVSQEAVKKLAALLELSQDTFYTQAELDEQAKATRQAVWRNKDHDQPVTVIGDLGAGPDGRRYKQIEGSDSGVPEDELEYEA